MIAGALDRSPGPALDWSTVYAAERWVTLTFFALLVLIVAGVIIEKMLEEEAALEEDAADD